MISSCRVYLLPCLLYLGWLGSSVCEGINTPPTVDPDGSSVLFSGGLTVKRGRVGYLHPKEIVYTPRPGGRCIVEVVEDDPMTQLMGTLEPKVFDCAFQPYDVRYVHNGSPLLYQDYVKLLIHEFHCNDTSPHQRLQQHQHQHLQQLTVNIANARYEIFVQDTRLRPLEVDGSLGFSNIIDTSVLRFSYNYYDRAICTVTFDTYHSTYPMYGQIVAGNETHLSSDAGISGGSVVPSLSHDCRDFLYLGLRYQHLRPPTPDVDYLPLAVHVSDPSRGEEPIREHFYLPIKLKGAYPNTGPVGPSNAVNFMTVTQFTMATLDPEVIRAKDAETPDDLLIFNITGLPRENEGYFVNLADPTRPIYSFLQSELLHHNIGYVPPSTHADGDILVRVQFTVYDSQFTRSAPINLLITVVPSHTTAPRVADNRGLTLEEGQTQVINEKNLHIVDSDNPDDVRVYMKGGLRHGRLEVSGQPSVMFSLEDLVQGRVTYTHDDSDSTEDRMMLRISDHQHAIRINFFIHILPRDDSAPYLVNNVAMSVVKGGYLQITTDLLSAHDMDSTDTDILYMIKDTPNGGDLVRKYRPMISGHRATRFTQQELRDGIIYYHHTNMQLSKDSFEFRLVDNNDPPNKSGKYGVTIYIHEIEDHPPRLVPGSARTLTVDETEIILITKENLRYTDFESDDETLLYTITNQPFFLTTTITIDAGRIVLLDSSNGTFVKEKNLVTVHAFTQRDINQGRVAYMPPAEDIGPIRRHARFMFTVADSRGNKVLDQAFDITILPVNNQIPHMTVRRLSIIEGGTMRISASDISAYDPDTDQNSLWFSLQTGPQYGKILKREHQLSSGDTFTLNDLLRPNIRYVHDGSAVQRDGFTLSVTDGTNSISNIVVIDVKLVNDHNPEPLKNLKSNIQVMEGGYAYITSANIAATDNDTDDQVLTFITISSPVHGEIHVGGHLSGQFSQADIWASRVKYVHTSGEVGFEAVFDTATFAVTDQKLAGLPNSPLLDLNVTILPVDNQAPYIVVGSPVFVEEGGSTVMTREVLSGHDADTPDRYLRFYITMAPAWGFLTNTGPEAMRKSPGRPVLSFTLDDVVQGHVRYVQAEHNGVEPMSDAFEIYITDGQVNSNPNLVQVSVLPSNDEAPLLEALPSLNVEEGGQVSVRAEDVKVVDADLPADMLTIQVAQDPMHGKVLLRVRAEHPHDTDVDTDTPVEELGWVEVAEQIVAVEEVVAGRVQIVYQHDASHNLQDKFTLQVSDGSHIAKRTVSVSVAALSDGYAVQPSGARLTVGYGEAELITEDELYTANTAHTSHLPFTFFLSTTPRYGVLQWKEVSAEEDDGIEIWSDLRQGQNFTQHDVDVGRVRYFHLGGAQEAATDVFSFYVTDGINIWPTETFEIEILDSNSYSLHLTVKHININEGDSRVIGTDLLTAEDEDSKPQDLVFRITMIPHHGHIGVVTEKNSPITTFSQSDLESDKIVYTHTSKADATDDSFHFVVTNTRNQSRSGVFKIHIEPFDKALPTLAANMPLTVIQGSSAVLSTVNLGITDPDTPAYNLTYHIIEPPQHGILLRQGIPILQAFTQHDVDVGHVTYESDMQDNAGVDFFLFTVSDSHHEGYLINATLESRSAFFNILIQPLSKEPPQLIINQSPGMLESLGNGNYGFMLSNKHLQATHPLGQNSKIVYTMLVKPLFGYLENLESGRIIKKRFRQRDLDESRLAYVLDGASFSSNDSFVFRVQDAKRNTLDNQRFEMEWSVIQFRSSQHVVCEDAEHLNVEVTRTGGLAHSAQVNVKYKAMSAKDGLDFVISDEEVIQFDAGVSSVIWSVEIIEDQIDEGNEKFRLLLKTPANAILGEKDRSNIQIVNLKDGQCSQYIGMVSKSSPEGMVMPVSQSTPRPRPAIKKLNHKEPITSFEILDDGDFFNFDLNDSTEDEDEDLDEEYSEFYANYRPADVYTGSSDAEAKAAAQEPNLDEDFDIFDLENAHGMIKDEKDDSPSTDTQQADVEDAERKKKKKDKKKKKKHGRNKDLDTTSDVTEVVTQSTTDSRFGLNAPQACTSDTHNLLFFDIITSKMYRCNGVYWEKWEPSETQARMFNVPRAAMPTTTVAPTTTSSQHGLMAMERTLEHPLESASRRQYSPTRSDRDNWMQPSQGTVPPVDAEHDAEQMHDEIESECEQGWSPHRDNCYRAFNELLSWESSERRCRDYSGHLADVESITHLQWLRKIVEGGSFWIGLNDLRLHHVWENTSGGPVRFYHWRTGFPRSQKALAKHCVLVSGKKLEWVNRPCNLNTSRFICSKPLQQVTAVHAETRDISTTKERRRRWRRRRNRGLN